MEQNFWQNEAMFNNLPGFGEIRAPRRACGNHTQFIRPASSSNTAQVLLLRDGNMLGTHTNVL
eukprot:8142573-Pyramimonas_sp.AAC.1